MNQATPADGARSIAERYADAAADTLARLGEVGYRVSRMSELTVSGDDLSDAIAVLLEQLPTIGYRHLKEDILQVLVHAKAKAAVPVLIHEMARTDLCLEPDGSRDPLWVYRYSVGSALAQLVGEGDFDAVADLLGMNYWQGAQAALVPALAKVKHKDQSREILLGLLADVSNGVVASAILTLGSIRAVEALPTIESLTGHPNPAVRDAVRKAIPRLRRLST